MHLKSENIVLWLTLLRLISSVWCGDNLALLSGTLRTFQKTTCDSEKVSLGCPRGTSISIELAQYEKNGIDGFTQCPSVTTDISTGTDATSNGIATTQYSNDIVNGNHQESCLWPNALQYSLLQTAIEACQKKTHCKFTPAPKSFGGNPCPGVRKIIEYAYKCRPYEFRSKVACENEVIQLVCNPFSRIAIYSANYGRTEYESIQCTQPQGVKEENCQVPFATETVMQLCHGRRRCTISADTQTFGNPCRPDSRMYLKMVYTCVPRKVLRESFDMPLEMDEQRSDYENELDEDDGPYKEAIPPAPKLQGAIPRNNNSTQQLITSKDAENIEGGNGVPSQNTSSEDHYNEIFYVCLFFGIAVLILLSSIMLVFGRLLLHKRNNSTMNSVAASVSELSATVDAMTKLQSTDASVVTTLANDPINNIESTAKTTAKITVPTTTTTTTTTLSSMRNNSGLASIDENIDNTSDIDLTTPMSIPSISNRNNQQHMYSTYGPNSYGNLDPNSISYALVTPDIYNANQTMTLHSAMMRPPLIQQNSQLSPTGSTFYARTLPPNLRTRLPMQSSPSPPPPSALLPSGPQTHHILIPTNATQTNMLNCHVYPYKTLPPNASNTNGNASLRSTSTFLPVSIATPNATIVPASIVSPMPPTSILRTTNPIRKTNASNSSTFLYG